MSSGSSRSPPIYEVRWMVLPACPRSWPRRRSPPGSGRPTWYARRSPSSRCSRRADPDCDPVVAAYVGPLAAWQAVLAGDPVMACRRLELCAERFEGIGDTREAASARLNFGRVLGLLGQIELAEAALRSSIVFF